MTQQHALIPISSLYRFFLCPGSFVLSQGMEKKETAYSEKGTRTHAVIADYLRSDKPSSLEELGYINFIREKEQLFGVSGKTEQRVCITPNVWGTADYTIVSPPYGVVIDYKDGVQEVEAIDNPQLAGYAVGLALKHNLSTVYTYIYQLNSLSPFTVKDWEMDETILAIWHDRILNLEQQLLEGKVLPCIPGEKQCQWCPAAPICEKRYEQMNEIVELRATLPNPAALSPSQLSEVMRVKKLVSSFLDSVEDYIRDNDIEVPNVEKKEGARNRKWANEVEARIRLENLGVEATRSSIITVAQAEKLLGNKFADMEDLVSETRNKTRVIYRG